MSECVYGVFVIIICLNHVLRLYGFVVQLQKHLQTRLGRCSGLDIFVKVK
jgi:hypothetical protein